MRLRQQTVLITAFACIALTAGCDQPNRSADSAAQKLDRAGEKLDRAGEKLAATTKDVASKAADSADDAALTAKVKAALFAEPGIKTLQIDVETQHAVVTLQGSVDSETLRQRAVTIAGSLSGVRQVVDKLVVKS